jgi:hypothetical protein
VSPAGTPSPSAPDDGASPAHSGAFFPREAGPGAARPRHALAHADEVPGPAGGMIPAGVG